MSNIFIVTNPDDVLVDGIRITLVNLDESQSNMFSNCFKKIKTDNNLIVYNWKNNDDFEWLVDKKNKSQFLFFNENYDNDLLNGYLAAQKNSYHFGNLRLLHKVNNRVVYINELELLLNNLIGTHEE
jgi:hypothetical protein